MQAGFAKGLQSILSAMPEALKTMKDPTISTKALSNIVNTGGDHMRKLFEDAQGGDLSAQEGITKALNEQLYPSASYSPFALWLGWAAFD